MKRWTMCLLALATLCVAAGVARADQKTDGFDRLRSLVGEWQGTGSDGKAVHLVYTLTSGGSAVMEQIDPEGDHSMVTMYHRDGDRLMLTHYCSTGNQPRMRAGKPPADGKSLTFSFVDATNLAKPSDPHMVKVVMNFADEDHFTEEWTFHGSEKDQTMVFRLERKK